MYFFTHDFILIGGLFQHNHALSEGWRASDIDYNLCVTLSLKHIVLAAEKKML